MSDAAMSEPLRRTFSLEEWLTHAGGFIRSRFKDSPAEKRHEALGLLVDFLTELYPPITCTVAVEVANFEVRSKKSEVEDGGEVVGFYRHRPIAKIADHRLPDGGEMKAVNVNGQWFTVASEKVATQLGVEWEQI